jgi:hypothetical protein
MAHRVPWSDVSGWARRLLQAVQEHTPKGVNELPIPVGLTVQKFWRSARLYDAVLTLLDASLPEESAFLGRSLF